MPFDNHAAYLVDKQNKPLEVRSAPYTKPSSNEIVVRAHAVAINPIDLVMQGSAKMAFGYISNFHVLGHDVAGEVVDVGDGAEARLFKAGDRVVGHAVSFDKRSKGAPEGAFQEYVVLRTSLAAKIPENVSFARACVIPLGLSAAAGGLFQKDMLGLAHPHPSTPVMQNETLVVWGGSTSVGSNAIQLARAAGYEVITTTSPKNFAYAKELGATQVFDYNDPQTPKNIIDHLKGKRCAGAAAIGNGSLEACIDIVTASEGRKFVAQFTIPLDMVKSAPGLLEVAKVMLFWKGKMSITSMVKGVSTKFVNGTDVMANEVGKVCYSNFLGQALAAGTFVPKPDPQVIGHGLEAVQKGFDYYRENSISTSKVVVAL
ncbi:zinc-binding oxidoreductase CipB [Lentithecium fluviatile CBS 122367]|uniref:Zinc-binding oxidoreductase CipB n=1 Tax=Lentithecium fluviatile CBS 122367 TaxID=1168545 RepID=A0A6G1IKK4_9PLEO|nr:zinc-binding oxidoreductase CipB [Lentithecium fluviatile CBS 122367]